jgi:hypothetical protein
MGTGQMTGWPRGGNVEIRKSWDVQDHWGQIKRSPSELRSGKKDGILQFFGTVPTKMSALRDLGTGQMAGWPLGANVEIRKCWDGLKGLRPRKARTSVGKEPGTSIRKVGTIKSALGRRETNLRYQTRSN